MMPRILAFASSTRRESFNKKLVAIAAQGAREAGAEVTLINLKDFPLPLFDQDLEAEQGIPENGKRLKKLFIDHDGLLIASPEYNGSFPAILKNAIDWVSRPAPGEPSLAAFRGKVATLKRFARCPGRSARAGPRPLDPRQHRRHRAAGPDRPSQGTRGVPARRLTCGPQAAGGRRGTRQNAGIVPCETQDVVRSSHRIWLGRCDQLIQWRLTSCTAYFRNS